MYVGHSWRSYLIIDKNLALLLSLWLFDSSWGDHIELWNIQLSLAVLWSFSILLMRSFPVLFWALLVH